MPERRIIPQVHTLILRKIECHTGSSEELHLFHGIDPEIRFHVRIDIYHVDRDPSFLGEYPNHLLPVELEQLLIDRGRFLPRISYLRGFPLHGHVGDQRAHSVVLQPQDVPLHLELGGRGRCYGGEPSLVAAPVQIPLLAANLSKEHERKLRTETRREPQSVLSGMGSSPAQLQALELRVYLVRIYICQGDGYAFLETFHKYGVLYAGTEGMPRVALGVHYQNIPEPVPERPSERFHLRRGGATSGGCVGLV